MQTENLTPACTTGFLNQLSVFLNSPLNNNTILVPAEKGKGFIKNFSLEEGLCISCFHCYLFENQTFKIKRLKHQKNNRVWQLFFCLGVKDNMQDKQHFIYNPKKNSTFLFSSDAERVVFLNGNQWHEMVCIMFTDKWLRNNFSEAENKLEIVVKALINKSKPKYIFEQLHTQSFSVIKEITLEMQKTIFPKLHIKSKSLLLLNNFLNSVVEQKSDTNKATDNIYFDLMINVESRLSHFYDKPFPGFCLLTREFNISAPTLKRHFKKIHGKSLQHFYIERKLAIGKKLLEQNKDSISEIAYKLGYKKINSFSKLFKKHYGILPKDVQEIN
jgi:AraC-like DNA-binding protein